MYFLLFIFSSFIISEMLYASHFTTLPFIGEILIAHGIKFISLVTIILLAIFCIVSVVLSLILKKAHVPMKNKIR